MPSTAGAKVAMDYRDRAMGMARLIMVDMVVPGEETTVEGTAVMVMGVFSMNALARLRADEEIMGDRIMVVLHIVLPIRQRLWANIIARAIIKAAVPTAILVHRRHHPLPTGRLSMGDTRLGEEEAVMEDMVRLLRTHRIITATLGMEETLAVGVTVVMEVTPEEALPMDLEAIGVAHLVVMVKTGVVHLSDTVVTVVEEEGAGEAITTAISQVMVATDVAELLHLHLLLSLLTADEAVAMADTKDIPICLLHRR
ncbi:hypothetical protein ACEPAH_6119 [Sanghuangporus vaninii]